MDHTDETKSLLKELELSGHKVLDRGPVIYIYPPDRYMGEYGRVVELTGPRYSVGYTRGAGGRGGDHLLITTYDLETAINAYIARWKNLQGTQSQ